VTLTFNNKVSLAGGTVAVTRSIALMMMAGANT
jgi:hypothetical protein